MLGFCIFMDTMIRLYRKVGENAIGCGGKCLRDAFRSGMNRRKLRKKTGGRWIRQVSTAICIDRQNETYYVENTRKYLQYRYF